jgi:hypothetical protein
LTPNSRSYLKRWAQPDSIIPEELQGIQAWDRYAYVNNNPIRFNDPSGNDLDCHVGETNCSAGIHSKVIRHDSVFNPYYGLYVEDIFDGKFEYEDLDNIDKFNLAFQSAHALAGTDLSELAKKGQPNTLTIKDIYAIIDIPVSIEQALIARAGHEPYGYFLSALDNKLGIELGFDDDYMNFDPYYLAALMEEYPDILEEAMELYAKENSPTTSEEELWSEIEDNLEDVFGGFIE